jgi:hypothetical protein
MNECDDDGFCGKIPALVLVFSLILHMVQVSRAWDVPYGKK